MIAKENIAKFKETPDQNAQNENAAKLYHSFPNEYCERIINSKTFVVREERFRATGLPFTCPDELHLFNCFPNIAH